MTGPLERRQSPSVAATMSGPILRVRGRRPRIGRRPIVTHAREEQDLAATFIRVDHRAFRTRCGIGKGDDHCGRSHPGPLHFPVLPSAGRIRCDQPHRIALWLTDRFRPDAPRAKSSPRASDPKVDPLLGSNPMLLLRAGASFGAENRIHFSARCANVNSTLTAALRFHAERRWSPSEKRD
jgi:hypothetical protein